MIHETPNGQVQYEGDSSTIDLHAHDEAVKQKIMELKIELMYPENIDTLMDILMLSQMDELIEPIKHFIKTAPAIQIIGWLESIHDKIESYVLLEYDYNYITNELWK